MLCGMNWLPPFALFGSRTAVEEDRVGRHVADWIRVLEALRDDRFDIAAAQDLPVLNSKLNAIFRED